MRTRNVCAGLLVLAYGVWGAGASAQEAHPAPAAPVSPEVRYITGGVGEDERAQLLSVAGEFNLKLVFAEKSGDYLAGVAVVGTDAAGRKVLDVKDGGPLVLARLPAGDYRISATVNGREQSRQISIPETGQRSLSFYW